MNYGNTSRYLTLAALASIVGLSACGMIGVGGNQGLFGDEFVQATLSRPNEISGTWELEDGYSANSTSAFQQTYGYTITKTRVRIDSPTATLMKVTTVCERRDQNNVNKLVSTYVNADAWVLIETTANGAVVNGAVANGAVVNGASTTTGMSGRITLNSFRNSEITGNKDYACVPSLDTGTYSFQIQDGRLFLELLSPINAGNQVNTAQTITVSGRSAYRKLRD